MVVGVGVPLHELIDHVGVLAEDELLQQVVDGEDSEVGRAPGFLQDEVGDELSGLQVLQANKEDGHLRLILNPHEAEQPVENILQVLLVESKVRGETVGSSGKPQNLKLVSHWQRVERSDVLQIRR